MSLVSRHLEAHGVATVVIGSARDIVEQCGVARFLFTDFPLGNPCGKPGDREMQRTTLGMALDLLESATVERTTVQTPFAWGADTEADLAWRDNYMRIDPAQTEAYLAAGEARRKKQAAAPTRE